MIIDLTAEIKKRKTVVDNHKEETLAMLRKVISDIEQGDVEECVIAYCSGDEYKYHCNAGSIVKFVGILDLTKNHLSNGI